MEQARPECVSSRRCHELASVSVRGDGPDLTQRRTATERDDANCRDGPRSPEIKQSLAIAKGLLRLDQRSTDIRERRGNWFRLNLSPDGQHKDDQARHQGGSRDRGGRVREAELCRNGSIHGVPPPASGDNQVTQNSSRQP